jgi:predicted hotdog family 3-hydroxylacyl-ACP dehydratase
VVQLLQVLGIGVERFLVIEIPVAELVPQSGPMCLLDRVLSHDGSETVCSVRVEEGGLVAAASDLVPVWVGIEYMAQCVAVYGGLQAYYAGERSLPGLFLGARRLTFRTQCFELGSELCISARHLGGTGLGLQTFACAVRSQLDTEPWIEGKLNVMILERFEDSLAGLGLPR